MGVNILITTIYIKVIINYNLYKNNKFMGPKKGNKRLLSNEKVKIAAMLLHDPEIPILGLKEVSVHLCHGNTIHNSWEVEETYVSINRGMVCTYSGILFSL